ncbi:MAG: ABC transporter ATP-binding protein [Candidatus Saccharicenans sp.]
MNALELIDLRKEFKETIAIDNLNLKIRKGIFFGFLGPNGAGKTTTIMIIAGLLKPTSGMVRILGLDIEKDEFEYKRHIGIVLDRPLYFEKLTGKEYLSFVGIMYRLEKQLVKNRTEELLSYLEIEEKKDDLIESYSAGMKKKISLGAAIIHNPDLLILDEPFEGIDPISAKSITNALKSMVCKGTTVFMTSHNLELVEKLCDEVAIINKGKLIFQSSVEKFREEIKKGGQSNLENLYIELLAGENEKRSLSWLE